MNSIQLYSNPTPRDQLITMTNIMKSKPEYFLQDNTHKMNLIFSIEEYFQNFPKGCAYLANQLITMDMKSASQFSSTFLFKLTQSCFNSENTQIGNNINLLSLITKIVIEVPSLFAPVLKKGSFLSKILSMDLECFNNDEQSFGQALLFVSKILKICGRASLDNNHLILAKQLIFTNFHIIEKDVCLFTNYLSLLSTLHPNINQQEIQKFKIHQKLFNIFENAKSLPMPLLSAVSKLIVRYCPQKIDLLKWLLSKAFKVSGGLAYQITINVFSVEFLISESSLILNSIISSNDPEVTAYYLKIMDHLLSSESQQISETQILRWLCSFQLLNHVQNVYFSHIKDNNVSEPVKGAILDFISTLESKCANLKSIYGQVSNIISAKIESTGFQSEIETNKHLLKKYLVQQQQQQQLNPVYNNNNN